MEDCFDKIYNSFLINKMGHAFLIETNDIEKTTKKILNLAKKVNCPSSYKQECDNDCNICFQIDNFCLPSIKFIEPIGQTIKKEQITEVKNKFNNNSLVTKYNIYIIKNAEKLNSSSANVLLKFLENPETDTIAFFVLNNKKNIISTIKSRCQIYSDSNDDDSFINEEMSALFQKKVELIFSNLLNEKSESFLKNKDIAMLELKDKKDQEMFLSFIFYIINNEIKERINNKASNNNLILSQYNIRTLINFAQKTKETIEKASYNVNMELLLDDYFIKMGELI